MFSYGIDELEIGFFLRNNLVTQSNYTLREPEVWESQGYRGERHFAYLWRELPSVKKQYC